MIKARIYAHVDGVDYLDKELFVEIEIPYVPTINTLNIVWLSPETIDKLNKVINSYEHATSDYDQFVVYKDGKKQVDVTNHNYVYEIGYVEKDNVVEIILYDELAK